MIRITDAIVLAYTKLRTRRIRTLVTVVIASLLFGTIALSTFMIQGVLSSMNEFSKGSLTGRYLVSTSYFKQAVEVDSAPDSVKKRATELYNKAIDDKKAAAKKLGIDYDPLTEKRPIENFFSDQEYLSWASPYTVQAVNEYQATLPTSKKVLMDVITPYHPLNIYQDYSSGMLYGNIKPIKKNIENFVEEPVYPSSGGTADISFGWKYIDQSITNAFMLPDSQIKKQKNINDIPLIAPVSKVEEALGLVALPNSASATDKLNRIRYVRDHAESATFSVCYRNDVSKAQIQSAVETAKQIKANVNNKDYQKPSLIYSLPTDAGACLPATVSSDTRTTYEKNLADKQAQFDSMFNTETEPIQQKVTFRVVGLSPNGYDYSSMSGLGGLITTIAGSTLDGNWVVPQQLFDAMPNRKEFDKFTDKYDSGSLKYAADNGVSFIVEFNNSNDAKNYVNKVGCNSMYCNSPTMAIFFGTNSILIDEIRDQVTMYLSYVAIAISVIAAFIMMGMTGRVIGDSRRETAVFRAIGAKRNDIRLIYIVYTLMLSTIIAIAALIIGILAAIWVNASLSPDANVQAHLTYIFANDNIQFCFIGIWWQALALLSGLIILAGLVGMLLPLSRNLMRNPIKDMRDDT